MQPLTNKKLIILSCTLSLVALFFVCGMYLLKPKAVPSAVVGTVQILKAQQIVAGQPVQWVALVKRSDTANNQNLVQLPKQATHIKAKPITEQQTQQIIAAVQTEDTPYSKVGESTRKDLAIKSTQRNSFTAGLLPSGADLIASAFNAIADLLNPNITTTKDNKFYNIQSKAQNTDYIQVTYQTPAPTITETQTSNKKQVTIKTTTELGYTNVVAYANIPELYNITEEGKIKINWKGNEQKDVSFKAYDLNNNGKLDYVEWTVPHLSSQTYEIIYITKAVKLDTNKNPTEDVYDKVYKQDNIWTTVNENEYIRVTFEKPLTKENDITIYAKPNSGNPTIQVYTADTNQLVTAFTNIDKEDTYKVLLTNLKADTDVFDLKVINGSVDFDYVVDPIAILFGSEYVFKSSVTSGSIFTAKLDSTHFVAVYPCSAVIGTVSGSAISYGSAYAFAGSCNVSYISAGALDSTHFIIVYADIDNSSRGTAVIGTVSGSTISYGSAYAFNLIRIGNVSLSVLDSTHFVVGYEVEDHVVWPDMPLRGRAIVGLVSGSDISYGSEVEFNSAQIYYVSLATLDSTHFVIGYEDNGNSDYGTAIVGTVSGTTISLGSKYVFDSGYPKSISVTALDSTHFVATYSEYFDSSRGTAIVGTVSSGNQIAYDSEYVFNSGSTNLISVTALDSTHFVAEYSDDGNSDYGTAIVGTVSGSAISYGSEYAFNPGATGSVSVASLDSTHFVAGYVDSGNSSYGTAVVGTYTSQAVFDQKHFKIYQDNAGLNSAAQYAGEDTNYNIVNGINFRIRFETANIGGSSGNITRRLEFKEDSGAWTQITTNSNNVRLVNSSNFTDADATTTRLTATGTFTTGDGKDTGSDAESISLSADYYAEDEYALKFESDAVGKTYQFRITNAGTVLDTYSKTPSITVADASTACFNGYCGSEYVFNSATTYSPAVVALDSTHFVMAYEDFGNSNYGTAVIGTVSGSTISYGSEYVFNSAITYFATVTALNATRFAASYGDDDNSNYGTAIVGTVSGSEISYGSEYVFNSAATYAITATTLDSTHFVTGYEDSSGYGTAVVNSLSVGTCGGSSSTDATLSAFTISQGTLSPTFASGTTSYTASVANAVTSMTVTPTVNESHATIKVNGTTVVSGQASGSINLSVGSNTITTVVTAQDGTTKKTYTLTVTRASDEPWLTGWSYRKKITIANDNVGADLTDFPVHVKITADSNMSTALATGNDIRFTSSDKTTLLKYEKETWSGGGGSAVTAEFWVKTAVDHDADTDIYVYWGKADAADGQDITNVWDTNFKGVWHLNDPTSPTDSTSNANGTNHGATAISGKAGGAASFNGSNNYISASSSSFDMGTGNFTTGIWMYYEGSDNPYPEILGNSNSGWSSGACSLAMDHSWASNKVMFGIYDYSSGGPILVSSSSPSYNDWHFVSLIRSGNSLSLYLDGASDATPASFSGSLNFNLGSGFVIAGGNHDGSNGYFNGSMDEVRISSAARDTNWVKFEYCNMMQTATGTCVGTYELTFAAEETTGGGGGGTGNAILKVKGGMKIKGGLRVK